MKDLGQVIFALWVPVQRLELSLEEVGSEGMTADSLEQSLHVWPPILLVVAHPGHTCLEDFRLTPHIKLITADESDQLAVRQIEKLLLGRNLSTREEMQIFIIQYSNGEVEEQSNLINIAYILVIISQNNFY